MSSPSVRQRCVTHTRLNTRAIFFSRAARVSRLLFNRNVRRKILRTSVREEGRLDNIVSGVRSHILGRKKETNRYRSRSSFMREESDPARRLSRDICQLQDISHVRAKVALTQPTERYANEPTVRLHRIRTFIGVYCENARSARHTHRCSLQTRRINNRTWLRTAASSAFRLLFGSARMMHAKDLMHSSRSSGARFRERIHRILVYTQ